MRLSAPSGSQAFALKCRFPHLVTEPLRAGDGNISAAEVTRSAQKYCGRGACVVCLTACLSVHRPFLLCLQYLCSVSISVCVPVPPLISR